MAAPTVNVSMDPTTYSPGEPMLLTVNYADPDNQRLTVTVTVADARGNRSAPVSVTAVIDPLTVTVADDSGRTWSRVSDNGAVAVFRAVA
ncbi:hypothetical protein HCA58_11695 [Micromonospora sp. HNM0581]|uniref:hypothetical protein n=1 Tax=Micromonospora sp. HNM0581 TaxID=2716341 RepID=UPI00146DCDEE|nr:hypothetical protein [Micromonospora sp. HNM0581]NLU79026.1 hypothetical protein [Micromonospora sp. HNM0581]